MASASSHSPSRIVECHLLPQRLSRSLPPFQTRSREETTLRYTVGKAIAARVELQREFLQVRGSIPSGQSRSSVPPVARPFRRRPTSVCGSNNCLPNHRSEEHTSEL